MRFLTKLARLFETIFFGLFMRLPVAVTAFSLVVGLLSPLILYLIPALWSKVLSLVTCCFLIIVSFSALIVDTFGTIELETRSALGPLEGISELRRKHGRSGIISYVLGWIFTFVSYYAILFACLDTLAPGSHFDNLHPSFRLVDFGFYSFVTVFLLGYGDITPISALAKILSASENIFSLLILSVVLTLALSDD